MAELCLNSSAIGVYKAILYVNDNVQLNRPDISKENEVDLISYGGGVVLIPFEDSPKWTRTRTTGDNYKEMFQDELSFFMNGLSENNNLILKTLRENKKGFLLELQLLNGQNILFQTPVFLKNAVTFDFNNGVHSVTVAYRVRTSLSYLTKLNDLIFAYSFYLVSGDEVLAYDLNNPLIINI